VIRIEISEQNIATNILYLDWDPKNARFIYGIL